MARACDVPLSAMTPVEGGHHCATCDKTVYDLRGATRDEALALFARSNATPCVRILPDARGFATFRRSRTAQLATGAALLATSLIGCGTNGEGTDHRAHPGEPHTEHHTDEIGLAGEPMMEDDPVVEDGTEGDAPPSEDAPGPE